ncbi:MAG: hypothetical protein HRU19_17920 [Pseudobacteriovorax sp.]|nr:hypothetical protein [Pseudobacteriovorax sp.]
MTNAFRLLSFAALLVAESAFAQLAMNPRYIYVVYGGIDAIWGRHMFMVQNQSEAPETGTFTVMLPSETIDWQGQDGFSAKDFKLGSDGGLEFTKEFKPGDNLHSIGFKTTAEDGVGEFSFKVPIDIDELSIMSVDLKVEGPGMTFTERSGNQKYDRYLMTNLKAGSTVKLKFLDVPKGRTEFWRYGFVSFALILLVCFGLAYRSRPKGIESV